MRINYDDKYTGLGLESPFYVAHHSVNRSELEIRFMLEAAKESLMARMKSYTHPKSHDKLEQRFHEYVVDCCTAWKGMQ